MKKYLAEGIGTFALVFCGTASVVVEQQTGNVGLVGIAIAFGAIIAAMIYTLGPISGAHINPAVTIGFTLLKKITPKDALIYIVFQIIGAIIASLLVQNIYNETTNIGLTLPSGTVGQSFILEIVTTFLMMITILGISSSSTKSVKALSGIVIGLTVTGLIFVAGPISGGSFNPARSLGPALIAGNHYALWAYIIAPILGTTSAALLWKYMLSD